jgi:hypothetical protein
MSKAGKRLIAAVQETLEGLRDGSWPSTKTYTQEELAPARRALRRMKRRKPVSGEKWAAQLAKDLGKFTD